MRVDLRRGDIGMAEHELHAAQVGAALEQVAGEGVAQHVRRDARRIDAGRERRLLQELARNAGASDGRVRPRDGNR